MDNEFGFNNDNINEVPDGEIPGESYAENVTAAEYAQEIPVSEESVQEIPAPEEVPASASTEAEIPDPASSGEYSCIHFNFADEYGEKAPSSEAVSGNPAVTAAPLGEEGAPAPKKKRGKTIGIIVLVLVCGIVFGVSAGLSSWFVKKASMSNVKIPTTEQGLSKAKDAQPPTSEVTQIAEQCMPSVVAITNRSVSDVATFFGTYSQESTSSGSGIIIKQTDTELLIVTNYHVVANSRELSVVFSSVEAELEAKGEIDERLIPSAIVKGYDAPRDLAVIAVKLEDIPDDVLSKIAIATVGDSSLLKPGDRVVAIGNALGYGQSVTTGIISAVNRSVTMESSDGYSTVTNTFIQTDAAINQGNSGGALLDMNGNLIGINSVKIAYAGVEGMGYAIPISDVEETIEDLMNQKTRDLADEDKQAYLGISGRDVTSTISESYGIPVGVYVDSVEKGLAADNAGISKGYIITKLDGVSILTISQLQERLRYYKKGETATVTVQHLEGSRYVEKELKVTFSHRSDSSEN